MSLVIYTDTHEVNKQKFMFDVDSEIKKCGILDNNYFRRVVHEVDKGELINPVMFKDRFGVCLYTTFLSTTSKALLCLGKITDKTINFVEVGRGVGDLLFENTGGSIYIPLERLSALMTSIEDRDIDVILHEKHFSTYFELSDYLYMQ